MNVGIDVGARKVSMQTSGTGGVITTVNLNPEDALIVAETMKQCAETLLRDGQRQRDEARDQMR